MVRRVDRCELKSRRPNAVRAIAVALLAEGGRRE